MLRFMHNCAIRPLTGRVASVVGGCCLPFGSSVQAQLATWVIVYAPVQSVGVPTLSEWGLLALAALLLAAAIVSLRRKSGTRALAPALLAGALSLGGFVGNRLVDSAHAIPPNGLSNPAGGTLTLGGTGSEQQVLNTSGVPQVIVSVVPESCSSTTPTCAAGRIVPAGESCYVAFCESDQRLKRDIRYLATLDNGIRIYSFKYLWDDNAYVGVMAQDLLASSQFQGAVHVAADGYFRVNYRALGLTMLSLSEWQRSSGHIFAASQPLSGPAR